MYVSIDQTTEMALFNMLLLLPPGIILQIPLNPLSLLQDSLKAT